MSAFEYVFAFYSLVLGLAAAEVVQGFAEMWRDRRRLQVGVATPLLAACVLLGVMNAWITFWPLNESISVTGTWLLLVALTALPYVFVSRLMFPRSGETVSLEDHFFQQRRLLLAGLAAPPLIGRIRGLLDGSDYPGGFAGIYFAVRILLPILLMLVPGRNWNRWGLAIVVLVMIVGLFR